MIYRTRSTVALGLCVIGFLSLMACSQSSRVSNAQSAAPTAASVDYQPVATFQQIMDSVVDPTSKVIWKSVSSVSDAQGIHQTQPRTDQDWNEFKRNAILLSEAANLIIVPGRRVAVGPKTLDDGDPLDVAAIQHRFDTKRAELVGFAGALRTVSAQLVDAADKRDIDAIFALGGSLDEACEACHQAFWYPDEKR